MVRTLILPTKYLINPYFVRFTWIKAPLNTASPNHHLKRHFSGSVDSTPWGAMLMNCHAGSGWSILRLDWAFCISMWNRWQRMGWKKEKVREELGEGWGSFVSDPTFPLCPVHENWGRLSALSPSWEHHPTESSGSLRIRSFFPRCGKTQERNVKAQISIQLSPHLPPTSWTNVMPLSSEYLFRNAKWLPHFTCHTATIFSILG